MTTAMEARESEATLFDSLWAWFSSLKLGLILILILAGASLLGALLPQVPGSYAGNPSYYNAWLEQSIRPKYGSLTDLFSLLRLFDVYNALWFRLIMGALAFNVVICTLNRWPSLWASVFKPRVRMNEAFYTHSPNAVQLRGRDLGLDHFRALLGRKHYQVKVVEGEEADYFYADKNGWAKLGTIATHLSLVLFLAGALIGGIYGFSDDQVIIPDGQVYQVNRGGFQFAVRNDKFVVEYYPDGRPKDFRSDLVVIDNGQEVVKKTIRVNDPLIYKGVRFHQAFYGAYAQIDVKDASGNELYKGQMQLQPQGPGGYSGGIYLQGGTKELDGQLSTGQQGVKFQVWNGQQAGPTGSVDQGQIGSVGDLQVTLQGTGQYTGLRMAWDPGVNLIWIASVLVVVGAAVTFYFQRRRIWGRVGDGEAAFAATADRFVDLRKELKVIVEELREEVPGLAVLVREPAPAGRQKRRRRE